MSHALPLSPFRRAAAEAVSQVLGIDATLLAVTTPPDPALGDYAVGCFPAAKALRAAPPMLAARVAATFKPTELLAEAKAAGPYVNFRIDRGALFRHLFASTLGPDPRPIPTTPGAGQTVVVDFASPNIAKHLAYHHIRSTVIGHALANLYRALGYQVVGINHLGDWGTTFGMLLAAHEKWGAPEPLTISALNDLYVRFRAAMKEDPALEEEGRRWFKRLEDGDPTARAIWGRFRDVSLAEFQEVFDLLGVHFDEVKGESEYEADMPRIIRELEDKHLTSVSEGALVVDLSELKIPPLLLRKADGATLYATRDLAAAEYRWEHYHFARALYVTDKGQSLHFRQLFATLEKAGHEWAKHMAHVGFGLVRFGGQKTGTRTGNVILLREVLAEAQATILAKLRESNSDLPPEVAKSVARDVGVGAIIFANLSSAREKDIDFDWDAMLSFEGDAGPYVQYAHARTASVLRRAALAGLSPDGGADPARLIREEEWALAKLLSELGDEAVRATESDEPHVLARFLLDVCAAFSRWYTLGNQDPSLKCLCADTPTARARLALAAATKTILAAGLAVLGLAAPDQM